MRFSSIKNCGLVALLLMIGCSAIQPTEPESVSDKGFGGAAGEYEVGEGLEPIDLSSYTSDYTWITVEDINDKGEIVGSGRHVETNQQHALLWNGYEWRDLGNLGYQRCIAIAINNNSIVVGYCYTGPIPSDREWFIWDGEMHSLGIPVVGLNSGPWKINDNGQILGWYRNQDKQYRILLWDNGFQEVEPPAFIDGDHAPYPIYPNSVDPYDMNNSGQIVGTLDNINNQAGWAPFLYDPQRTDPWIGLPELGGGDGHAHGINNQGLIVGTAQADNPNSPYGISWNAVIWGSDGTILNDLGRPDTGIHAVAVDINDNGDVIVRSAPNWGLGPPYNLATAWLWDGGWTQLGGLGGLRTGPIAINIRGEIIGQVQTPERELRAVAWRLIQTPEDQITRLVLEIKSLVDSGVMEQGESNSLSAKLEGAIRSMEKGNTGASINQLQAFINQIEAMIRSGRIETGKGQSLINTTLDLIEQIRP
ncbi:hypothetical protein ACFL3H_07665 [Gemmatimonadota bacterium]